MGEELVTVFEFIQRIADRYPDNPDIYSMDIHVVTECHGCCASADSVDVNTWKEPGFEADRTVVEIKG